MPEIEQTEPEPADEWTEPDEEPDADDELDDEVLVWTQDGINAFDAAYLDYKKRYPRASEEECEQVAYWLWKDYYWEELDRQVKEWEEMEPIWESEEEEEEVRRSQQLRRIQKLWPDADEEDIDMYGPEEEAQWLRDNRDEMDSPPPDPDQYAPPDPDQYAAETPRLPAPPGERYQPPHILAGQQLLNPQIPLHQVSENHRQAAKAALKHGPPHYAWHVLGQMAEQSPTFDPEHPKPLPPNLSAARGLVLAHLAGLPPAPAQYLDPNNASRAFLLRYHHLPQETHECPDPLPQISHARRRPGSLRGKGRFRYPAPPGAQHPAHADPR